MAQGLSGTGREGTGIGTGRGRRRRTAPPRANSIFSAVSPLAAREQVLSSLQIEPSWLFETPPIKVKYYATLLLKWPSTHILRALTTQKTFTQFMSDLSFALCRQVSRFIRANIWSWKLYWLPVPLIIQMCLVIFLFIFTLCKGILNRYFNLTQLPGKCLGKLVLWRRLYWIIGI